MSIYIGSVNMVLEPKGHNITPDWFSPGSYTVEFENIGEVCFDFDYSESYYCDKNGENFDKEESNELSKLEVINRNLNYLAIGNKEFYNKETQFLKFDNFPKIKNVIDIHFNAVDDLDNELDFEILSGEMILYNENTYEEKTLILK